MENKGEHKAHGKETRWHSFRNFLWNSETNECLGRTGLSWFRITIFYIIFYACLAAFWICLLVVFFQTLANDRPKWTLDSSRIGSSPGLGFRPSRYESTGIWLNLGRSGDANYWVDSLNDYLEPYKTLSTSGEAVNCTGDQTATPDKPCHFPIITGIENICSPERGFGYPEGKPCVLIKLNRIFDWKPEPYDEPPQDLVKHLKEDFDRNQVYITCTGRNAADRDNIGEVHYYPSQGIASKYFPFTNQKNYVSPFVFVQFNEINGRGLVNIECRAWAKNIHFDRKDKLGSVQFELQVY